MTGGKSWPRQGAASCSAELDVTGGVQQGLELGTTLSSPLKGSSLEPETTCHFYLLVVRLLRREDLNRDMGVILDWICPQTLVEPSCYLEAWEVSENHITGDFTVNVTNRVED